MATLIETKNGKKVVLLNPAERSKRYARELLKGVQADGTTLTDTEAAFRMGVLNERKTQAKIYNKQNGLKSKSRKKPKFDMNAVSLSVYGTHYDLLTQKQKSVVDKISKR